MPATTRTTNTLGGSSQDPYPPVITSLTFGDEGGGSIADRALVGSRLRLVFSARDLLDEPDFATLRHRREGTVDWSDASLEIVARDYDAEGHELTGTVYASDLSELARREGTYEIEIFLSDEYGNSATIAIEPAIEIVARRQRPVRR